MENGSLIERRVTAAKMCHSWKNWITVGKVGDSLNGSKLEKWITVGKIGSQLGKRITAVKMCHSWKNGPKLAPVMEISYPKNEMQMCHIVEQAKIQRKRKNC